MMIRSETPMRTAKTCYIIMSASMAVFGVMLIAAPGLLGDVMCTVLGISAAIFGAVKLVSYFSKDLFRLAFQHDLAGGLLLILLGVTAALRPQLFLGSIGVIFGVMMLADGLFKVQVAIDAKAFGIGKWWLILAAAIVTGTAAFFLMTYPIESMSAVAVILGAALIAESVLNLVTVLAAVKIVKNQKPDDIITVDPAHTH